MNVNSLMSANLAQLMQTVNISLLKSALSTQAAQATVILNDFTQTQQAIALSHPTLGRHLDIKV